MRQSLKWTSNTLKCLFVSAGYLPSVPVWYLRLLPALFGSFLVPLSYQVMVEMKFSRWTATLAACLIIGGIVLHFLTNPRVSFGKGLPWVQGCSEKMYNFPDSYPLWIVVFHGFVLLFADNALLTQSRFMLIDMILLFFVALSLYCVLRFKDVSSSGWALAFSVPFTDHLSYTCT